MQEEWFAIDDAEMDDTQKAFVDTVRPYARTWPECPPSHAVAIAYNDEEDLEEDEEPELRLVVDVSDLAGKRILLTLGASLVGNQLRCSQVHNQTYLPLENSRDVQQVEAFGPPEELGQIAAAWFGEVLRRPVIARAGITDWVFVKPGSALPNEFRWLRGGGSSSSGEDT